MITNDAGTISDAQSRFDQMYITGAEIMRDLQLSRPALLYARRMGKLPGAISLNNGRLFLWERQTLQSHLDEYKDSLILRRGV